MRLLMPAIEAKILDKTMMDQQPPTASPPHPLSVEKLSSLFTINVKLIL